MAFLYLDSVKTMIADFILAWMHHLCFLGMAAALAMQWTLLGPSRPAIPLALLGKTDAWYGSLAMLILAIGAARVAWGPKGAAFYLDNPVFWAKIAVFLAVGAISALPTINYLRWRQQARNDPAFQPSPADIGKVRKAIRLQFLGWLALPILAAAMARGI
ncbi:DUF2214 family protein [Pigmentiphaga sp. H8]|uniref:DUF2214 family protein n=1 Tax=unclassified Pigmentiphaga TaxID=2626614 RepID=UPI000F593314|nr:DUF2214 family protein [Pigmentiphaga sp. H8]AZG09914.1 DUF2214 family protein [Pigmentiphaga sp. H8]